MSFILGRNVIFSVLDDGDLKPVACGRTCKLTTTTEIAPKSTIYSGKWQENKALSLSWNVSSDGVCSIDNYTIKSLRTQQQTLSPIWIEFSVGADEYSGYALIDNIEETGNYNDAATFNFRGLGTGKLFMNGMLPPAYPSGFVISDTDPGVPTMFDVTATFTWDSVTPTPTRYTIRVRTVAGVITLYSGVTSPWVHVFYLDDPYYLSIRSEYDGVVSDWSPEIRLN